MYQVIKRDGKVSGFDIIKIADAIKKAFEACEKQYNDNIIDLHNNFYLNLYKIIKFF